MAHGDYNCCAVCDSKLAYSFDAATKEEICADCAVSLHEATGVRITTPDDLIAWLRVNGAAGVAVLQRIGFSECVYTNPVDQAYRAAMQAAPAGEG